MKVSDLKHAKLKAWVEEWTSILTPADVEVCDGTQEEYDRSLKALCDAGLGTPLNPSKRPGC